jgi:hypothetical protein
VPVVLWLFVAEPPAPADGPLLEEPLLLAAQPPLPPVCVLTRFFFFFFFFAALLVLMLPTLVEEHEVCADAACGAAARKNASEIHALRRIALDRATPRIRRNDA